MAQVYHKGELKIQEEFGELKQANRAGRMITNTIIPGAVPFIENQVSTIVSSLDDDKNVWISILVGKAGFTSVPNLTNLIIDIDKLHSAKTDVFYTNIKRNPIVGSLFIELGTRRRYRVNGNITLQHKKIHLAIDEAYPNCPKYIQRRLPKLIENDTTDAPITTSGHVLIQQQKEWISKADTFFVGSINNDDLLDASHRGGSPGFVQIQSDGTLKIPDYIGNKMYNTLGNIHLNNKAGLLFIDFKNRSTLQLSGIATLVFNQQSKEDTLKTTGTGRYWLFNPKKWIQTENHHVLDWEFLDASPLNP